MISTIKKWFLGNKMKKKDKIVSEEATVTSTKDKQTMSESKEKTFTFKEVNQLLSAHKEILTNNILTSLISNTNINRSTSDEKSKVKYAVESTVNEQFVNILAHLQSKKK